MSYTANNTIEIIRGEPWADHFDFSSDTDLVTVDQFDLSVRLLTARGTPVWTKTLGAGLTRTSTGWLLSLTTTDTAQAEGNYTLALELKAIASGIPVQITAPVEIVKDLITP